MPVDLTPEEKTKFEEYAKEHGYDDHAKDVIARVNAEAKTHREAKEKIEAELKTLRDQEAKRKTDDDARKTQEAEAKKKADDEKKTAEERALDERLAKIDSKFEERFAKEREQAKKQIDDLTKELSARDQRILEQAVRSAAVKRGIIDEDLVRMLDVSKIKIEQGVPISEEIDTLVEDHAKSKPHLYKGDDDQRQRGTDGRFERPTPTSKLKNDVDWSNLSDEDFEKREKQLRSSRT